MQGLDNLESTSDSRRIDFHPVHFQYPEEVTTEEQDPMEMDDPIDCDNFSPNSSMQDISTPCHFEPMNYHCEDNSSFVNIQDWQSLCKQLQQSNRSVYFAEISTLQVYEPNPLYEGNKSYTREERKHFSVKTVSDALTIKRRILMSSSSHHGPYSSSTFLKSGIISPEEIAGVEHFLDFTGNSSATQWISARKEHGRAVVMEQRRLQSEQNSEEDIESWLAKFSASISSNAAVSARSRAVISDSS